MSILQHAEAEHASRTIELTVRDRIDIWRIARDEVFPLRHAELHRDHAATLPESFDKVAHLHTAAIYEAAFELAARQSAVEMLGLPVQGPVDWPACGLCGIDPAQHRVFCDAQDGGELLACDACADSGNHLDSPAIAWMERVAIGRVGKVRVDSYDEGDLPTALDPTGSLRFAGEKAVQR